MIQGHMKFLLAAACLFVLYAAWEIVVEVMRRRRINLRLHSRCYDIPSIEIVQALRRNSLEKKEKDSERYTTK